MPEGRRPLVCSDSKAPPHAVAASEAERLCYLVEATKLALVPGLAPGLAPGLVPVLALALVLTPQRFHCDKNHHLAYYPSLAVSSYRWPMVVSGRTTTPASAPYLALGSPAASNLAQTKMFAFVVVVPVSSFLRVAQPVEGLPWKMEPARLGIAGYPGRRPRRDQIGNFDGAWLAWIVG